MDITRDNIMACILAGMKEKKLSRLGLEKAAGVPQDTIRDFMRGKTQILRADKLQKVMAVIGPQHKATVAGYMGPKAEIFPAQLHAGDEPQTVDCPPGLDPADVVAIRIQSDAMMPVFHPGWVVYYAASNKEVRSALLPGSWHVPYNKPAKAPRKGGKAKASSLEDFHGKPCIVKLKDGRLMLRTLKPSKTEGVYNLIAYNTPDIKNEEVAWAAKIIFIKT